MINTHVHRDHTGGNENFAKQGVTIFARPELRDRLMHPNPASQRRSGNACARRGSPGDHL